MRSIVLLVLAAFSLSTLNAQKTPDMLENVISSVVTVAVYKTEKTKQALGFRGEADKAYEKILDLSDSKSSGSGFVIKRNGKMYVVTNAHVVENASDKDGSLFVFSINRNKYPVKIVGGDSFYDLAVLEFLTKPGKEIKTVDFRTKEARVGERVFAVGNPLGEYPYTVTDGIVSAKNRVRGGVTGKFGFIQTTATVIWGNSGGPLVDADGRVLGINSQIAFARRGKAQIWQPQINFALEANISIRLINDILSNDGLVKRAYVGLEIRQQYEYNSFMALYGSPWVKKDSIPVINNVMGDSPANSALSGKKGAEIISINGVRVRDVQEVLGQFEKIKPGSKVSMEIRHQGKKEKVQFTSEELQTKHLEGLARYVIKDIKNALLTKDGKSVIIQGQGQGNQRPEREMNKERPNKEGEGNERRRREDNLRYRGKVEQGDIQPGREYRVIAGGIENKNYSSVWRVNKMSDLGATFRLSGLAGVFNVYVADPYSKKPKAVQLNPSGNDKIYQITLWY